MFTINLWKHQNYHRAFDLDSKTWVDKFFMKSIPATIIYNIFFFRNALFSILLCMTFSNCKNRRNICKQSFEGDICSSLARMTMETLNGLNLYIQRSKVNGIHLLVADLISPSTKSCQCTRFDGRSLYFCAGIFSKRKYVVLKYFRHMTSQKYCDLLSKCVHRRDLVLGEIRSVTSTVLESCGVPSLSDIQHWAADLVTESGEAAVTSLWFPPLSWSSSDCKMQTDIVQTANIDSKYRYILLYNNRF